MFRRKKNKSRLGCVAAFLLAAFAGAGLAVVYLATPDSGKAGEFRVDSGEGVTSVAERLKDDGVIRNKAIFLRALQSLGLDQAVKPGVHDLAGVRSYAEIAARLAASGKSLHEEVTLTVKEGWNLRDIRAELERLDHPAAAGLYEVTGEPLDQGFQPPPDWLERYPFLKTRYPGTSLEGFLFPDTYRIYADADAEDVVRAMLDNFGRKMDSDLMNLVRKSGRDFRDVIVMASVVEREVRTMETRRMVADIFWRRLDGGMRLQADSTVNYVTGGSRPSVTSEDLAVRSAYSTYASDGLPPGPIASPGLAAVQAVLTPTPNDFLFFLTDDEGGVHYATTFSEHVRNKQLFLR